MVCRSYVQLPIDLDGIDASIDTQILKSPHTLLVQLADLENGRNPDIGTLKKERGGASFQNAAPRDLKQNSYVMSTKYYFKW